MVGCMLHVTSKNDEASEDISDNFQSLPSQNMKPKVEEAEVYIEIIRNHTDPLEEHFTSNISSSYEAFWKGDFQSCLERRTCMKCGLVFLTPQQLLHHLKNLHVISNPQECFVCRKIFINELEKKTHLILSHNLDKPELTCEACFKVLNSELDKKAHTLLHMERNKCMWCSEPFPCEYLLNCHLQQCSLHRTDQDCHICGCHFRSSHILQLHSLRHSRITCEICNLNVLSMAEASLEDPEVSLIRHLKSNHSPDEINNILLRLKKRDEEEENLDKLFMTHIEENLSQLTDSTKQNQVKEQTQKSAINLHHNQEQEYLEVNVSSSTTTWRCSECPETFECKEDLIKHELEHQAPFSCIVCSLKFRHRRGFKKHMRSHGIQVKPESIRYKCKQCSVKCATMSALRIHLLTHTDQKPHLCDKCGLKFRRPHALKAHEHAVHKSRILYRCPQCDTSSLSKSSLLRHVQCVHGGVRRFICGMCGTRCLQNQGLRRHLRNAHKLDFPPLESLCKKSSTEIHIVPPAENLVPNDPLVGLLKFAVQEEKLKLDLLSKQQQNVTRDGCQPSESSIGGQSLNILGDVASKAVPLQQINCTTSFIQPSPGQKLQKAKFLCAVCQQTSNDLSIHLIQCQRGKTLSFVDEENSVLPFVPVKPPVAYTFASSLSNPTSAIASGIPYQFCVIQSLNGQLMSEAVSINDNQMENPSLPSVSVGSISHPSTKVTGSNLTCPGEPNVKVGASGSVGLTGNASVTSTFLRDLTENSRMPCDIVTSNTLESSNSYQLELLGSSTFSFQDDDLIRDQTNSTIFDLNHSETFISERNLLSSSSCNILENHDDQQNILSRNSAQKISQVSTEQVNNARSTLLSDQSKTLDVSNSNVPSISQPDHEGSSFQALPSVLPVDGVIPTPSGEDALNFRSEQKSLPDNTKNEESTSDLTSPLKDYSSTSEHNAVLKSNLSSAEPGISSHGSLGNLVQTCPECGKQLSSASTFKRHLKIHYGGKSHECSYCGKCFLYKCNLTVHVRSHTGVRPFECTVCGKKFRYHSEWKEHKQSHNRTTTFNCLHCGQHFARQRDLRRHSLSHQNSEKPKCHICQKTFSRADYLKRHIKSHKLSEKVDVESLQEINRSSFLGLQEINRSPSDKTIMNKCSEKTHCLEETTNVCTTQSMEIVEKTLQEYCKKNFTKPQSSSRNSAVPNLAIQPNNSCTTAPNSDDLISLAYQAAEDGVEFIFVEKSGTSSDRNEIAIGSSEVDSSVVYVQILDSAELNM